MGVPEFVETIEEFLNKVENGEVRGIVSVIVLNEIWYKLIIAEVSKIKKIQPSQVPNFLKTRRNIIKKLKKVDEGLNKIIKLGVGIEGVEKEDFEKARKLSKKFDLLTNDSLIVACMKRLKIRDIATNDVDFERVKGIKVWKP